MVPSSLASHLLDSIPEYYSKSKVQSQFLVELSIPHLNFKFNHSFNLIVFEVYFEQDSVMIFDIRLVNTH